LGSAFSTFPVASASSDEIQPHQRRIRLARRKRPRLDQHDRRAPERQVVTERPHLELIVVAADLAGCKRFERVADHGAHLLRQLAARVLSPRLVVCHRQQRDGRRPGRIADGGAPALVVKVEADSRVESIPQRLEDLSFRSLKAERVAIDVDALGVAPLKTLGAVRVQHRHDVQGQC
jgi:hypothetical protein